MSKIFISYRRHDSQSATGRILDRLKEVFKSEEVFLDVDSIPQGVNFLDFIKKKFENAEIIVAVVGKHWANSLKERENDSNDFVRLEIEQALAAKIPILPVYVEGAKEPGPKDLPQSIQGFAYFNGLHVRPNPDFENDMLKVIDSIKKLVSAKAIKRQTKGKTTWFDRIKYMLLGIIMIVSGSVAYYYNQKVVCNGEKKGILIANFQNTEHDGFSNSILTQLKQNLKDTTYDIHTVGYQPRDKENYDGYIKEKFFTNSCTPKGLFVNGFLSREQGVFNFYTSLVNTEVKLPEFISDKSVILANPKEITFTITEDAKFISDLIMAIIRVDQGDDKDGLKRIIELEKKNIQDREVKATLAFLKGQCYALKGDEKRAAAEFRKAKDSGNGQLTMAAERNIYVSYRISREYQKSPETATVRQKNIEEQSKFEKDLDRVNNALDKIDKYKQKLPGELIKTLFK
jgi:predicted negative regulator of RcsB-dependent stress response